MPRRLGVTVFVFSAYFICLAGLDCFVGVLLPLGGVALLIREANSLEAYRKPSMNEVRYDDSLSTETVAPGPPDAPVTAGSALTADLVRGGVF